MKKSATNSRNTTSKTEKGLKHLRLIGVGREYLHERLAEMQKRAGQVLESDNSSVEKTNGRSEKK